MSKTYATAVISDGSPYGARDVQVRIFASRAAAGAYGFDAPRWRPMVSKTLEGARRKIETHPGFVEWI